MSQLERHVFAKMNGIGNEIIVLDLRADDIDVTAAEARAIHQASGLAYDQLMVLLPSRRAGAEAFMRILNNDGSESAACGNGTRCVAYWLTRESNRTNLLLETSAGLLQCERLPDGRFSVDMGAPRLRWQDIPLASAVADTIQVPLADVPANLPMPAVVSMGNPHAIFFVATAEAFDLATLGPMLEHHPMFPERANISLAEISGPDQIRLRVWERGAGQTLACGTAACASLVAAVRLGLTGRSARVSLPGGDLDITWRASDDHVIMTGPVELEFVDAFPPGLFDRANP